MKTDRPGRLVFPMDSLGSIASPVELIRSVFEDASEVRVRELRPLVPSIVLQSVADGRVLVLLNSSVVRGSLAQLSLLFLSHFEGLRVPCTFTAGKETGPAGVSLKLPKGCSSVTLHINGFVQCSATFSYVAELPRGLTLPLLCVGFAAPPDSERLHDDFETFLADRAFPFLDVRAVARQRVKAESRNRDFLLHAAKTRQELVQRYTHADQALQRRSRQLQVLAEEAELLLGARQPPGPAAKLAAVEKTIERIDEAVNELAEYTQRLADAAAAKADGRHMTRKEETALLEALKNQVRDARRQLEALT
jgi:hypothetical protein